MGRSTDWTSETECLRSKPGVVAPSDRDAVCARVSQIPTVKKHLGPHRKVHSPTILRPATRRRTHNSIQPRRSSSSVTFEICIA